MSACTSGDGRHKIANPDDVDFGVAGERGRLDEVCGRRGRGRCAIFECGWCRAGA